MLGLVPAIIPALRWSGAVIRWCEVSIVFWNALSKRTPAVQPRMLGLVPAIIPSKVTDAPSDDRVVRGSRISAWNCDHIAMAINMTMGLVPTIICQLSRGRGTGSSGWV